MGTVCGRRRLWLWYQRAVVRQARTLMRGKGGRVNVSRIEVVALVMQCVQRVKVSCSLGRFNNLPIARGEYDSVSNIAAAMIQLVQTSQRGFGKYVGSGWLLEHAASRPTTSVKCTRVYHRVQQPCTWNPYTKTENRC